MDGTAIAADPLNARWVKAAGTDPADCCGSGCVRCIFDSHDDAMERYRAALAEWNERTDSDND